MLILLKLYTLNLPSKNCFNFSLNPLNSSSSIAPWTWLTPIVVLLQLLQKSLALQF